MSPRQARRLFEKVDGWCKLAKQLTEAQERLDSAKYQLAYVRRQPPESFLADGLGGPKGKEAKQRAITKARANLVEAKRKAAELTKKWDARGE